MHRRRSRGGWGAIAPPPTNFGESESISALHESANFFVVAILREFETQNPKIVRASGAITTETLNLPQNRAKNRAIFNKLYS